MSLHPLERGKPRRQKYHCPMTGCKRKRTVRSVARLIPNCPDHRIQMEEDSKK